MSKETIMCNGCSERFERGLIHHIKTGYTVGEHTIKGDWWVCERCLDKALECYCIYEDD